METKLVEVGCADLRHTSQSAPCLLQPHTVGRTVCCPSSRRRGGVSRWSLLFIPSLYLLCAMTFQLPHCKNWIIWLRIFVLFSVYSVFGSFVSSIFLRPVTCLLLFFLASLHERSLTCGAQGHFPAALTCSECFLTRELLPPKGHPMSGDSVGCHTWGRGSYW